MTQEDKELLLKDLCARLLYKPNVKIGDYSDYIVVGVDLQKEKILVTLEGETIEISPRNIILCLRPMDSMTEKESDEFDKISIKLLENGSSEEIWDTVVDWLNVHHFDHRHLIEKGLAIEAPEDMYK